MAEDPPLAEEPGSLLDARGVDRLCDRFEAAWQSGVRPALDAFLAEAPVARRAEALRQLLLLDVEYRQRAGEVPTPDDYLPLCGDDETVVRKVFARPSSADPAWPKPGWLTWSGSASATAAQVNGDDRTVPAIPGYEVLGELGQGGMGVVYRARQLKAGRVVALKMIRSGPHASPEQRARFRTEVEAIARLQHPHIVQVHEVGEHAGQPFFSLEFCARGSLSDRLAGTPLPPAEAAALVEPLARAMHAAHQKGVVHRDLKPANVLLTEDGTPKVTDFGLAKMLGEATRTATGELMGTPSYMAPEQASGRGPEVGPACDVYALGAILYECLIGRPPFKAPTPLETVRQVCDQEPVSPRSLNRQVPRDLETICLKCLEKDPARRYASAGDLADDLGRFRAGAPILARPPSALWLTAYWLRRRPAAVSALVAAVLLVVAVTVGSLWYSAGVTQALVGEKQARRAAQLNEDRALQSEARAGELAYASDLRLACQLLNTGNVYQLPDLLDRHVPAAGADDRREFAWFYAHPFSRASLPRILIADHPEVTKAAFSADGRLLLAATKYHTRVLEMPQGLPRLTARSAVAPEPRNHGAILAVLTQDGGTLATVLNEKAVYFLDVATGRETGALPQPARPEHLALSADGKTVVTVAGGQARLWDAHTLTPLRSVVNTDRDLWAAASSPDGLMLALTPTRENLVRLWDLARGALCQEVKLQSVVRSLTYSPRGEFLAACLAGGAVELFRTDRGRLVSWRGVGPVSGDVVAFSPDGGLLAVGVRDEVRLWDLRGRTFRGRLRWQTTTITALAFSADGQALAAGTANGLLHLVKPDCPPTHDTLRADLRPSGPLAASHDGKTLALPDEDGTVKLVDAGSGEVRLALPGHSGRLADCTFSPDGRTLATAGEYDTEVRLWDTGTGREKLAFRAGLSGFRCLAFSPRGDLLAASEYGAVAWVWDLATGDLRGKLPVRDSLDLAFSPDGRVLASCDLSAVVCLWDVPPQGALPAAPREQVGLASGVKALAFAPVGRILAAGLDNGEVQVLEVPPAGPARRVGQSLTTGDTSVLALAFAADGRSLLVNRSRGSRGEFGIGVWDVPSRSLRTRFSYTTFAQGRHAALMPGDRILGQTAAGDVQIRDLSNWSVRVLPGQALWPVASLAFSPDGRSLYLGTAENFGEARFHWKPKIPLISSSRGIQQDVRWQGEVADAVRVWDMERLTPGPRLPGQHSIALPDRIALSADGRLLAAGGGDGSVRLWDLAGQRLFARLFLSDRARAYARQVELLLALGPVKPEYDQKSEAIRCVAFSPDRRWLAAVGHRGTVTVWDTDTWQEHHPVSGEQPGATWVGFGADSTLAVACKGQVRLCDPRTGEVRGILGAENDSPVLCGAFDPGGRLLATGTAGQAVRVWDVATTVEKRTMTRHLDQVNAVAFSPDGRTLASSDESGTVKLWAVASLREVASLEGRERKVSCLAFSPDGQTLAAGAETERGRGEVFLWRAPRPAP